MLTRGMRLTLLTIAVSGCQSQTLDIGSGAVGRDGADAGIASDTAIASDIPAPTPSVSCSDLVPGGLDVRIVFLSGAPPDLGKGGTIVDGVYNLIQSTIYQSMPTTQAFIDRETIRISQGGRHLEYVTASNGFTMAESIAPEGASLNPTTLCPGPGVSVGPYYTATPNAFVVVNGLYVKVFARDGD
jgi:hypothetical protein